MRRRTISTSLSRSDPEARALVERDELLRSLEDLERERTAGDISEKDYALLRREYLARTSALLDAQESKADRRSTSVPIERRRSSVRRALGRPRVRRVLLALFVVWLALAVAAVAAHYSGLRLPGETETGSVSLSQALVVQNELAQAADLSSAGEIAQAIQLYGDVLQKTPRQQDALTYQGWLIRLSGLKARDERVVLRGDKELALAAHVAPKFAAARALDAIALGDDEHRQAQAAVELRAFVKDNPSSSLVVQLRSILLPLFRRDGVRPPRTLVPSR